MVTLVVMGIVEVASIENSESVDQMFYGRCEVL